MAVEIEQEDFRIGSNSAISGRTWRAALNTRWSYGLDTNEKFRIRFHLTNFGTTVADSNNFTLYFKPAGGSYSEITTGSSTFKLVDGFTDSDGDSISTSYWISNYSTDVENTGDQYSESSACTVDVGQLNALGDDYSGETEVEFSLEFTGAENGRVYYFRVYNNDSTLYAYNSTASIRVKDTTSPSFSSTPGNQTKTECSSNHTFTWVATDYDPDNYIIQRDTSNTFPSPTQVDSGSWTSGGNINYTTSSTLSPDVYYYRCIVYDSSNNSNSHYASLTVNELNCSFSSTPTNTTVELGNTDTTLNWDTNSHCHADTYDLVETTGGDDKGTGLSWATNGPVLSHTTSSSLSLGDHIYRCTIRSPTDSTYDEATVTVQDTTDPSWSSTPSDAFIDEGQTHQFTWNATDLSPDDYTIERDTDVGFPSPTTVDSGSWSSGVDINYTTDSGLAADTYFYRCTVNDLSNNSISDVAKLEVEGDLTSDMGSDDPPKESISINIGMEESTDMGSDDPPKESVSVNVKRDLPIAVNIQRDTQLSVNIKRDVPVSININRNIQLEVDVNFGGFSDLERFSVSVQAEDTLDLAIYDSSNSRWKDGKTSTSDVSYGDVCTKLIRKEELNKLSTLEFTIKTNDSTLIPTEGDILALGKNFRWSGTPDASSSSFDKLYFEGVITKKEEDVHYRDNSGNYISTYKLTAMHYIHTLSSVYKTKIISYRKVMDNIDVKSCTLSYIIDELLDDVTYYDVDGNTVSSLPVYLRNDGKYIKHREYINTNLLEMLLDICEQSNNVFYCHDDKFFVEAKKPIMANSTFKDFSFTQEFRNIIPNASIKIEDGESIDNSYDLSDDTYTITNCHLSLPIDNSSTTTAYLHGLGFWLMDSGTTATTTEYSATLTEKSVGTLSSTGASYDFSTEQFIRSDADSNVSISAKGSSTSTFIHIEAGTGAGRKLYFGCRKPAEGYYPYCVDADGTSADKWIWRTNASLCVYKIMNSQIRFFDSHFPSRFMRDLSVGNPADAWILRYDPFTDTPGITGIGMVADEVNTGDDQLYSGDVILWCRDYTYLPSGVGDNRLIDWDEEITELYMDIELDKHIDADTDPTDSEVSFYTNLDWNGNGYDDWIRIRMTHSAALGVYRFYYEISNNGSVTQVDTDDIDNFQKLRFKFKHDTINTWLKVAYYGTSDWVTIGSYVLMDDGTNAPTPTGNGLGLGLRELDHLFTIQGISLKKVSSDITIDLDYVTNMEREIKDLYGQFVVISKDDENMIQQVIGKYPETPDSGLPIKIVEKNVKTTDEANSVAKIMYENQFSDILKFNYREPFIGSDHENLSPNSIITFDGSDYIVTQIDTEFGKSIYSKIVAGEEEESYFEYLTKQEQEKNEETSKFLSPILVKFNVLNPTTTDGIHDKITSTGQYTLTEYDYR